MDNHWGRARKEMGFSKEDSYPLLVINSSDPNMPPVDVASRDGVLTYLFNSGFIGSYQSHSAIEKQGLLMM